MSAPTKIWLQWDECPPGIWDEVRWCATKTFDDDVEYVKANGYRRLYDSVNKLIYHSSAATHSDHEQAVIDALNAIDGGEFMEAAP